MIKMIALVRRRSDISESDFFRIWSDDHPGLVRQLPGLLGYQQNHALPHRGGWRWDGAAEMWFADRAAVRVAFDGPPAEAVRRHEEDFIGEVEWFLVEERPKYFDASFSASPVAPEPD